MHFAPLDLMHAMAPKKTRASSASGSAGADGHLSCCALVKAAAAGDVRAVNELLSAGCDANAACTHDPLVKKVDRGFALHAAAAAGSSKVVAVLLAAGVRNHRADSAARGWRVVRRGCGPRHGPALRGPGGRAARRVAGSSARAH
jgi:hypothetical protein